LAFFVKNAVIQGRMDGCKVHDFPGSHRGFEACWEEKLKKRNVILLKMRQPEDFSLVVRPKF
jgi:hypothetical protein